MIRQLRQIAPNRFLVLLFAVLYMLTYRLDWMFMRFGAPVPVEVAFIRLILIIFTCAIYGYFRVRYFHPFYSPRYRHWLTISPWTFDKPLPLGPAHLTWVDLVVVGTLVLLGYLNGHFHPAWPAIFFLGVYLVLFWLALSDGQEVYFVLFLVFVPFSIFPHRNLSVSLAVMAGLYVLLHFGFRRQFKSFPWNTPYWQSDPVEELRKGFAKKELVGWPHQMLRLCDPIIHMNFWGALGVAALLTWWVHVVRWTIAEPYGAMSYLILVAVIPFARLAAYVQPGYLSPISLFGRIFTLRWIMPRYDKIVVAPICILLAFRGAHLGGSALGLGPVLTFEVALFLEVLLALAMPPSLRSWRLTGAHRLARAKVSQQKAKMVTPAGPKAEVSIWKQLLTSG